MKPVVFARSRRCFRSSLGLLALLALSPALQAESNFPPEVPLSADVCMTCHGGYGQGSDGVGGPKLAGMEPWYLKRQLLAFRAGYRGVEKDYIPGHEMRITAEALEEHEIDAVIAEIAAWPEQPVVPMVEGDAVAGASLYTGCAACHGMTGEGNEALSAPALAKRNDWYLLRQLELFAKGWRGAHADDQAGQQMRAMMGSVTEPKAWQDLVAYINTL
jgi:cytochrome c553